MKLSTIEKRILAYCAKDEMGLWVVIWDVTERKYEAWSDLPEHAKEEVLQTIQKLMEADLIEAGSPNGPTFRRFPGTTSEITQYIRDEWNKLGKQPSGGDVSWFRATPKGIRIAKELNLSS